MYITGKIKTSRDDLSEIFDIRERVFQHELKISSVYDRDEFDQEAYFAVVSKIDNSLGSSKAIATGRLIIDNEDRYKIGRIAVLPEERGKQYGDMIVKMLLEKSFSLGASEVYVGAQHHAIGFYEKIGFTHCNIVYMDLGIKHFKMVINQEMLKKKCKL